MCVAELTNFGFLSTGIIGVCYHAWLIFFQLLFFCFVFFHMFLRFCLILLTLYLMCWFQWEMLPEGSGIWALGSQFVALPWGGLGWYILAGGSVSFRVEFEIAQPCPISTSHSASWSPLKVRTLNCHACLLLPCLSPMMDLSLCYCKPKGILSSIRSLVHGVLA